MADEKKPTFKITVPPNMSIRLMVDVVGDSGHKHNKYDPLVAKKCKERITTKGKPYIETGVSEKRVKMFRPYEASGVKIEPEGKEPKKDEKK